MMGGTEIKLDAEEIPKVLKAISSGNPCICKQGIFNPSSYSCIVRDTDRAIEHEKDEFGHYTGNTRSVPLNDIFKSIKELINREEGKLIGSGTNH